MALKTTKGKKGKKKEGKRGPASDRKAKTLDPGADIRPSKYSLLTSLACAIIACLPPHANPLPTLTPPLLRTASLASLAAVSLAKTLSRVRAARANRSLRVTQDKRYHNFADARPLAAVPNAGDVLSNVPFCAVGIAGFWALRGLAEAEIAPAAARCYAVFFAGVFFVGAGSGYYHWRPCNETLVWDRLPMTVGFVASYCAILEERVGAGVGDTLLVPSLILGAFSVFYWAATDDLTLYAFVQMFPLLTIPVILAFFPATYTHSSLIIGCLFLYALAKVTESNDKEIFALTRNTISGHSLKHIISSIGALLIAWMLVIRAPIGV